MKNTLKRLLLLFLVVICPITVFLTACGATATNTVNGVTFVSKKYDDETGFAVFEVDLNTPTKLTYKASPSTWSGYTVTYTVVGDEGINQSRYTLENGEITVSDAAFQRIRVMITINRHSSFCFVQLKEYPSSIKLEHNEVVLNAHGSYTIPVIGVFNGVEKYISDSDYNFEISTSDETTVSVPDKTRLKVTSLMDRVDSATITIKLNDTTGERTKYELTLKVNVVKNVNDGYAVTDGKETFVQDGDEFDLNLSDLNTNENGDYLFNYKLFTFSLSGYYVYPNIECLTNQGRLCAVDNENHQIIIDKNIDLNTEIKIGLWTNLTKTDGTTFGITFTVTVK
ncbi:MAG: hypothetical protein IJ538_04265 [Clostridia bacterium]|nr:hypothetical protein [Clostridia bacterium]